MPEYGDATEVELLLNHGLNPNTIAEGQSLLERAIRYSYAPNSAQIAIKLIQHGADVTFINEHGQTYLHKAANCDLIDVLVSKGLDVNAKDNEGRLPLESYLSDPNIIKTFLKHNSSNVPLSLFEYGVIRSPELTQLLLDRGDNVSEVNKEGRTPFLELASCAAYKDETFESLKLLINAHSDVNHQSLGGWTALHYYFSDISYILGEIEENTNIKAIRLLIDAGAKPLKDTCGRTPLMTLTRNGFHVTYCNRVRLHFYKFEAEYYGIPADIYLEGLRKINDKGFDVVYDPPFQNFSVEGSLYGLPDLPINSVPKKTFLDHIWEQMLAKRVRLDTFLPQLAGEIP
jgi:ankyrin repeat protein